MEEKFVLQSKGVVGGIIGILSSTALIANSYGFTITGEELNNISQLLISISAVIGNGIGIYGRITANSKIVLSRK